MQPQISRWQKFKWRIQDALVPVGPPLFLIGLIMILLCFVIAMILI